MFLPLTRLFFSVVQTKEIFSVLGRGGNYFGHCFGLGPTKKSSDGSIDGWVGGMNRMERMDRMDKWMDGWMDRWIDGWMDE